MSTSSGVGTPSESPVATPYFTVSELRARYPDITEARWSDDDVEEMRDTAESAIEEACGVAFTPRTETVTLSGSGSLLLELGRPRLRTVASATDSGDAMTLTDLAIVPPSSAYLPGTWTSGVSNLSVTFTHGYDSPPLRVKQAAMMLTKAWLVQGPIDERLMSVATEEGILRQATPGFSGSEFGIPEVDQVVKRYRWPAAQIGSVSLVSPENRLLADYEY